MCNAMHLQIVLALYQLIDQSWKTTTYKLFIFSLEPGIWVKGWWGSYNILFQKSHQIVNYVHISIICWLLWQWSAEIIYCLTYILVYIRKQGGIGYSLNPFSLINYLNLISESGVNLVPLIVTLSMLGKMGIAACFTGVFLWTPEMFATTVRSVLWLKCGHLHGSPLSCHNL